MAPEPMRRMLFGFSAFIFVSAVSHAVAPENSALHFNRAQSVINAFQVICS